jgi:hypothetical protein
MMAWDFMVEDSPENFNVALNTAANEAQQGEPESAVVAINASVHAAIILEERLGYGEGLWVRAELTGTVSEPPAKLDVITVQLELVEPPK